MDETRHLYPDNDKLQLADSASDALEGADALIICTEWHEFRSPDWQGIKNGLTSPVIFDGRNLYEPDVLSEQGITYYCIGRRQA